MNPPWSNRIDPGNDRGKDIETPIFNQLNHCLATFHTFSLWELIAAYSHRARVDYDRNYGGSTRVVLMISLLSHLHVNIMKIHCNPPIHNLWNQLALLKCILSQKYKSLNLWKHCSMQNLTDFLTDLFRLSAMKLKICNIFAYAKMQTKPISNIASTYGRALCQMRVPAFYYLESIQENGMRTNGQGFPHNIIIRMELFWVVSFNIWAESLASKFQVSFVIWKLCFVTHGARIKFIVLKLTDRFILPSM